MEHPPAGDLALHPPSSPNPRVTRAHVPTPPTHPARAAPNPQRRRRLGVQPRVPPLPAPPHSVRPGYVPSATSPCEPVSVFRLPPSRHFPVTYSRNLFIVACFWVFCWCLAYHSCIFLLQYRPGPLTHAAAGVPAATRVPSNSEWRALLFVSSSSSSSSPERKKRSEMNFTKKRVGCHGPVQ